MILEIRSSGDGLDIRILPLTAEERNCLSLSDNEHEQNYTVFLSIFVRITMQDVVQKINIPIFVLVVVFESARYLPERYCFIRVVPSLREPFYRSPPVTPVHHVTSSDEPRQTGKKNQGQSTLSPGTSHLFPVLERVCCLEPVAITRQFRLVDRPSSFFSFL